MRSQIIAVAQYASSSGKISGPKNPAFLAPTVAFQVSASSRDKCSGGGGRPSWGKGMILEWSDIAIAPKVWAARSVILIGKIPWFWSYGAVRIEAAGAALKIGFGRET